MCSICSVYLDIYDALQIQYLAPEQGATLTVVRWPNGGGPAETPS